jgi:predicted DNA-binding transcriptional regulator AlpA
MSPAPSEERLWHAADDTAGLPHYVRFRDLVEAKIVGNWSMLARLIAEDGFPQGIMLGRNTRGWLLSEVKTWLSTRPAARKIVRTTSRHISKTRKKKTAEAA